MTDQKKIYFDDLVKENILSFLPSKKYFKLGTFYNKMFFFDEENHKVSEEYYSINITKITRCYVYFRVELQPDIEPFILKKKKKKDEEGEYVAFIPNDICKPNEKLLAANTQFFHQSDTFRPDFLITENKIPIN